MAGRLYSGTSGWNYKHWRGIFYPDGMAQSKWLQFYAQRYDTVEINNSFYRLPERHTYESWHDQSPEGFVFAVKASRYLTHMKKLDQPEETLSKVLENAAGLQEKLGPVLYHLPPHWKLNMARFKHFVSLLPKGIRHVVEFRDPTWQVEPVFELLRENSIAYCVMSSPDLPCHIMHTTDFSYVRMHSGGHDTGSNYTDDGLCWWADQIRPLLENGDVYIYFNNDYNGYAIRNATKLKELLGAS